MRTWLAVALIFSVSAPALSQAPPPGSPQAERERWNRVFSEAPPNIRTDANAFLVRVVSELKPGDALDVGMGFGRNALFLARQGWKVTGIDIFDVGVEKARAQALADKLPLVALQQDANTFDYGKDRWDLIAVMYMGPFVRTLADRLTDGLKPGGVLVIEHFLRRAGDRIGYESNVVPGWFPRLQQLRYFEEESNPDYDQQNKAPVVRFLARKPSQYSVKPKIVAGV